MKSMRTLMFAGLAAAGLALAGCGSDGGPSQAELDAANEARAAQEQLVMELRQQIADLAEEAGVDDPADVGDSVDALRRQIADLQKQIDDAAEADRMAKEEAARMAAAATGKALFAALAGTSATTNALGNIAQPSLSSSGLAINANADAGTFTGGTDPDSTGVTLEAGDSAEALGSWDGMHYGHINAGTKVENAAVVYSNRGPGKSESFADAGYTVATETTGTARKGSVLVVNAGAIESGFSFADVMATAFIHSGRQSHAIPGRSDALYVRGTYDGAPGEYRCTGTCTSTNDGKGSPSGLGGTWHFKPDAGAMVHQPDADYLYYGWWVSKDKDGGPTAASAFTGTVGTITGLVSGNTPDTLTGSATYVGHAAGKFALDYSRSKLIDGTSDGGHFTADATLTAKFGGAAVMGAGISGTIDNFRLNDGTEDPGWSVALHRANWASGQDTFATPPDDANTANVDESMGTTWSIDGTAGDRSGTWSGQMYDEMPGDPPGGDGSNIPTTATGTFYSEHGTGTSTVGRMVGAFGANKQ